MAVRALAVPTIRAADVREVSQICRLHEELWFDHETRGGLPASHEPDVWKAYEESLKQQLSQRRGRLFPHHVFDGKLGHLIAEHQGELIGQVEIYLDRFGVHARTPYLAELRSLIVSSKARNMGLGANLVRAAAKYSTAHAASSTLIVAEVLAQNPALRFYERLGFRSVEQLLSIQASPVQTSAMTVRSATTADAFEVTRLDLEARTRRYHWGDPRFDPPQNSVDEGYVQIIKESIELDEIQRTIDADYWREELLAINCHGRAVASAYLVIAPLISPFAPVMRAEVARLSANPSDAESLEAADALMATALARATHMKANSLILRAPFLDPMAARYAVLPNSVPFSWIVAAPAHRILANENG